MNKLEDMMDIYRIKEFMHKHELEEEKKKTVALILIIIGGALMIGAIAFAIYKYVTADDDYEDDFEDDFDDDFEDDFEDEFEDDAEEAASEEDFVDEESADKE